MQIMICLLKWCDRKAITLVPVHLPGVHNIQADSLSRVSQTLNTEWTMAMERLWPVFAKWGEPQVELFATFANKRLIKFVSPYPDPRAKWTDAMTMEEASCMLFRHSRWSLKFCRRSLSHQASGWFRSLHCNRQLHGFRSWWIWHRKIQSCCSSRVKICWLKTFGSATGWQRLVTTGRQIYTRGNYGLYSGPRAIPGKLRTWCQGPFVTHRSRCMNPIGQDSCPSVGRKGGTCFKSEVIISAPIWCICSETDISQWR